MSEVSKEDKSYSVEDQLPSKELNFGSSRVLFAHQATAGDKSIDLTNLVVPPDMLANGFVSPTPAQIAGSHLSVLRKNLTLISTRGALTQFLDYVVSDAGTINFLPTSILGVDGALEGEIFTGVIDEKKAIGLVVGDVKEYDVTMDDTDFTPGGTTLNVGSAYRVNENPMQQTGEIRVFKNGQRIYRNVGNATAGPLANGNYQEIDSGTGMGTTIELNVPTQVGDIFGIDMGLKISQGDIQIFEEIERLQGTVLKLATDTAPALGNPISDYFTANPSETERRSFGDLMLKILETQVLTEENYGTIQVDTSGTILTDSLGLLSGAVWTVAGRLQLSIIPGKLTQNPTVVAMPGANSVGNGAHCSLISISPLLIDLEVDLEAGTNSTQFVGLFVGRTGADIVGKKKIKDILGL